MKFLIFFIGTLPLFLSCSKKLTGLALGRLQIDSMVSVYNAYWNKQDSAGVASLFAPDAIVSDDNRNFLNTADILNKWIHPNIRMVRNLKTTKIQEWSAKDRAGYTGFYEIDLIMHDSIIARPKGVVTFNFIKNKNGWQITTAHLHSFFTRK